MIIQTHDTMVRDALERELAEQSGRLPKLPLLPMKHAHCNRRVARKKAKVHAARQAAAGETIATTEWFRSALLEFLRCQLMPPQQFVEIGTVALGQTRRLADIAAGDLQDLRQIAARELVARLIE
jgi:hypothetical protein